MPVTPSSEYWDEWDLGKLPLRVFTPEELMETKNKIEENVSKHADDAASHHTCLKGSISNVTCVCVRVCVCLR